MGGFGTGTYEATEQLSGYIATFPAAGLSTMKVYLLVSMEVVEKFVDTAMKNLKKQVINCWFIYLPNETGNSLIGI